LSAFGDRLYFSSERPGGKGKKDIWVIGLKEWKPDGTSLWGELLNLGDSINTPGDEISPFIHPGTKDLYFSSDDLPGFGGLDLFHSRLKENGEWSRAENLGWPVNSPGNEQGFVIDRTGTTAYFSTDREKRGNMDIYMFETDESFRPKPVTYVRGKVISDGTGMPVPALVEVTAEDISGPTGTSIRADERGIFLLTLPPDRDLLFTVNEKGYLFYTERVRLSSLSSAASPLERVISLIPAETGTSLDLYNIYFQTNEHTILPESIPELQILLHFLSDHPGLSVEIGGHTDNTGTREFNRTLSEKRAASVKQYLVEGGISENRLTSKGYGFDQPVATNDTEEGRARNRRTTMKITAKDPK
jgi:outer membrane protein OmpA-like peptidoglycan-associated protein